MLDKTILVFYVDVGDMSIEESHNYIDVIKQNTQLSPEDQNQIMRYIIPTREGGTRVECINPSYICRCNNTLLEDKIEMINDKLDRVDNIIFPITRKIITEKHNG